MNYSLDLTMRPFLCALFSIALIFLLCHSADCQSDSIQARIELKASVDRPEVPLNEKLTFTVQASWVGEQNRFSITPVIPPECENLEILGSSSLNESKIEEGKTKSLKTFNFVLKPVQTGKGRIGSVQVNYVDHSTQDSSSLSTQPISVQVTPSVRERGTSYKTALVIAIVAVLIYVVYTARRKTKRIQIPEDRAGTKLEPEEQSLEEKTLQKLDEIYQEVQPGRLETFPSLLHSLLTGYLESRHHVVTSGKTTNDIISSLSNLNLPAEKMTLLKEILSKCDLVKYAGERVEREKCEEMIDQTRKFLEQNR